LKGAIKHHWAPYTPINVHEYELFRQSHKYVYNKNSYKMSAVNIAVEVLAIQWIYSQFTAHVFPPQHVCKQSCINAAHVFSATLVYAFAGSCNETLPSGIGFFVSIKLLKLFIGPKVKSLEPSSLLQANSSSRNFCNIINVNRAIFWDVSSYSQVVAHLQCRRVNQDSRQQAESGEVSRCYIFWASPIQPTSLHVYSYFNTVTHTSSARQRVGKQVPAKTDFW
jgi:hypothetical protein